MSDDDDRENEPVAKLPRKVGFKLGGPQLLRIGLTGALLALVLVMRKPCSDSVGKFITDFGSGSGSAATQQMPKPGTVDKPLDGEIINAEMTPEEFKAAIDRARARAGSTAPIAGTGSGSGSGESVGSGSAGSGSAGAGSAGSGSAASAGVGAVGPTGSTGSAGSN